MVEDLPGKYKALGLVPSRRGGKKGAGRERKIEEEAVDGQ